MYATFHLNIYDYISSTLLQTITLLVSDVINTNYYRLNFQHIIHSYRASRHPAGKLVTNIMMVASTKLNWSWCELVVH